MERGDPMLGHEIERIFFLTKEVEVEVEVKGWILFVEKEDLGLNLWGSQNRSYIISCEGDRSVEMQATELYMEDPSLPKVNGQPSFLIQPARLTKFHRKRKVTGCRGMMHVGRPVAWCRATQQGKHACIIGIEAVRAHRIVSVHRGWCDGGTL